jgi:hypothetical protein
MHRTSSGVDVIVNDGDFSGEYDTKTEPSFEDMPIKLSKPGSTQPRVIA